MSSAISGDALSNVQWTAEQVLGWMDSFRELILSTAEGDDPYERLRRADPMRQMNPKGVAE